MIKRITQKLSVIVLIAAMSIGSFGIISAQDEEVLNILYWQAVSTMNPYLSGGTKDLEAASLTLEPLARFDADGVLVPYLAAEIPTLENGGFAEDFTSITWTLKDDLVWSDGTPVTSADLIFTYEYCSTPETGCAGSDFYADIDSIDAVDDLTITINFTVPKPFPYLPFVSVNAPILQQAQFEGCVGAAAASCTDENFGPVGTGPFVVSDFRPNDVVEYVANENYREEGKPFFDRVIFKGGGDAEAAARAVLETGEVDYAWNLQISPAVLSEMEAAGQGQVVVGFTSSVERILLNQTNDDPSLGEDRSLFLDGENPHPFLTNPTVKQAMSMAIDRNIIAEQLYGDGGVATCNVLNGPPINVSPNNDGCLTQDLEGAAALLDEAGIVDTNGDGWRELDGVELSVIYQTSTNAVRQSTQALIKQWWESIGIETELRNVSADVFFGGDPSSPDTYQKFYTDIEMFTSSTAGPDAQSFMGRWICSETPGPENGWLGGNVPRFCDAEYDALFEQLGATGDPEERAEIVIQMNDLLVSPEGAIVPLVFRGDVSAHANSIEGVQMNGWDSELWNIADWTRTS